MNQTKTTAHRIFFVLVYQWLLCSSSIRPKIFLVLELWCIYFAYVSSTAITGVDDVVVGVGACCCARDIHVSLG